MSINLSGVGPKTQEKLQKLGIFSDLDLIYHFPYRYIDFSHHTPIALTRVNENFTITGVVIKFQNIYTRYGKNIQKAIVRDNSASIDLVWFNQSYLSKTILVGETYSFAGTVTLFQNKKTIIAPVFGHHNTGKIIPIYPETKGLTSAWFRKILDTHLNSLIQTSVNSDLPPSILQKHNLLSKKDALAQIHSPSNNSALVASRDRLALDEIMALQANSIILKNQWLTKTANRVLKIDPLMVKKINKLIKSLPFKLTRSQLKVWHQVLKDLVTTSPSNRLIQGDVGSGKTIIALLGMFFAHLNKTQSLFIAPTEILANQHYQTFQKILTKEKIKISLLTASSKLRPSEIQKSDIIIATHAVFFKNKNLLANLSLLVIDEQHKFGVKQRSFLSTFANLPHTITMTATPIPRTLSLALLGNLDLSYISELPQNRLPIKTFLVPQTKYKSCYDWISAQIIKHKTQVYIVCPFIEESDANLDIKAAAVEFEKLQSIFPQFKLALIHGKTPPKTREQVFADFKDNKIHILVTTPIIEVGIDIPNASIIIIQSADHFGLAQLHQLRGRVGRGDHQSYCYLFTESNTPKAIDRLKYLETHHNGLKIAEYDLKIRGPGEIFSYLQHGFPSLKLAALTNADLISKSQEITNELISRYPEFDLHLLIKSNPSLVLADFIS